ncbi:hypothetical protein ACHAQG_000501 [Verticillium nonalfalfae]
MPIPSHEDRQRRLLQLAEQWGVEVPSATSSLSRPSHPPTYRNTDDDFYAEELVKRRQLSHGRTESTGNLRKAFSSSKKKSYDPKIVFDALNSHVANSGRAGAAESLINLLISSGGDVNLPQKPKQGLLSRRKSLETFGERSRLLQQAVQNGQADMVAVLLPHADTVALDTSLPIAMRNQNTAIVELLLRYGAGAASTADAQDAVRQACVTGGQAEIVSLVLRSEGRPSASWLSQCMIDATRAACVSTVMRLARSTADGSHKQAQALKIAISQGRHDIVLAILLGSKPPRGQGLDEAFTELIGHPSINPNDKISMVEMLLCAGAEGDGPSLALLNSASAEFLEMLHVLVTYGTSIEYRDAMAVRKAISNGRVDVAHILLAGNSPLSSLQASECVELIPKDLALEHRRLLLDVLLRRGASGNPLHDVLIEAVRAGDVKSVNLLVTPQFPGSGRPVESQSPRGLGRRTSKSMVFERHEVASVDYKNGLALQIAVSRGDVPMASVLLASKPSGQTVARVFAETSALPPRDKLGMVECFLSSGLPSQTVQNALQEAIDSKPPNRDEALIALLLRFTNDVNSSDGALLAAVTQKDVKLLAALLRKNISPDTAAGVLPSIVAIEDPRARLEIASLVLSSVPGMDPVKVSSAMLHVLNTQPADMRLLQVLLQQGRADINFNDGAPLSIVSAVRFGGEGEELVRILLQAGADPNYYNGEAVWAATRSANVGSLKIILAVGHDEKSRQRRASSVTLIRALNAAWKLSGSSRLMVLDMLFKAGLPVCEELHICLNKAVNDEAIDEKAIEVLVAHGATPNVKGAKTLVDAAQRALPSVMRLLLEATVTTDALNLTVVQSFTNNNAATWFSDRGFLVLQALILKGAQGAGLTNVLGLVINMVPQSPDLGGRFMDLLFENEVDVDHEDGKLLESATSTNNIRLVQRLLEKHPKTESLSRAFHHIFDQQLSEDEALQLIQVYTEYSNGETRLDVMYSLSDSPPVLFLALARFPRSFRIMKALLDAGFYHDQTTVSRVMPEIEEEETVTLLTWALIQPQKKVSSNIIQLLLDSGAKVNFETRHSRLTPLMLAIHARRPDVTKELLLKDADVDVTDAKGNTPLSLASDIGGDVAITMMSNLLAAGASRNDGSLQNAARELNLAAVQVLVEYGHDPDFPSHLHDGRSALGEICLHGAISGEMTAAREKQIEKVMNFLLDKGSDISVKCSGKSLLHLALESSDPVAMTRLLLKVGMWKLVNKKFNLYRDGVYTYSPTMYVAKILPKVDVNEQLLRLLRANRCEDVFFANRGPQPDDAIGLPDDVALQERERRARLSRLASEQEDYEVSITRSKELAAVQAQIWANQAELEDARRKRAHSEEMEAMGDRARAEEEVFAAAMRRRKNERVSEASHEKAMAEASALKARQEMELDKRRHLQALDWERNMATERVDHAKALSALRIAEREDVERMDRQQDERATRRIAEQRRLVESQTGLAGQLTGVGPQGRRQIGYVAGELNN